MQVTVTVSLKPGILDPESQTILQAIHNLGDTRVQSLMQKRAFVFNVLTSHPEEAREIGERLGQTLLANPVMQRFDVSVNENQD